MPVFRAEWHGLKESLNFLERLGAMQAVVVGRGVGRAAIQTQDIIRNNLQNMIYAQSPAASGYQRTYTLMRSTHAASPSASHDADERRAHGGADLAATDIEPLAVVETAGSTLASEVGSWASYASFVHDGVNQPQPRPFVSAAVPAAEAALHKEITEAILREFAARQVSI